MINLYGSSETGHLLIEDDGVMRPSPETAVLEVASPDGAGVGELLVTTLTNPWLPLLRYEIGDYVEPRAGGYLVHGRKRDALRRADGGVLTTRQLDQTFADVTGVAHYQLRQQADGSAHLALLPEAAGDDLAEARTRLTPTLCAMLGAPVSAEVVDLITPEDSGKFRLTVRETA